ncbi:MAG: prephenate dehydrogenase [Gemmatimonadetes bacterium]|nr:prephenate dehydrogenase [Gemmatimonadota bacterium]
MSAQTRDRRAVRCVTRRSGVGILGCGRFGAFLARHLAKDFSVVVYDVLDRRAAARSAGAGWGSLEDVARCRWIVTAVPIGRLPEALAALAPRLAPSSVVVEVSSVKALPVRWLREILPSGTATVPTHPLFGPDSAARSLHGLPLVVCPLPEHVAAARRVSSFARSRGLRVVTLDAESHDRLMAETQALTFFLSRALNRLTLPNPAHLISTPSYRRLRRALASVALDTDELYRDLVHFNPHAESFVGELTSAVLAERMALFDPASLAARSKLSQSLLIEEAVAIRSTSVGNPR